MLLLFYHLYELEELAVLLMSPGSRILLHRHKIDREVYIYGDKVEVCEAREWHFLPNESDSVLIVISVKTKA